MAMAVRMFSIGTVTANPTRPNKKCAAGSIARRRILCARIKLLAVVGAFGIFATRAKPGNIFIRLVDDIEPNGFRELGW